MQIDGLARKEAFGVACANTVHGGRVCVTSHMLEDHPFSRYRFDAPCALCGAEDSYLDEIVTDDRGGRMFVCSDTDHCESRRSRVLP